MIEIITQHCMHKVVSTNILNSQLDFTDSLSENDSKDKFNYKTRFN